MENRFMINKCLSSEHKELAHLLDRFRKFLRSHSITEQADWNCHETTKLLADLKSALESEVPRHFAVEENDLFPILANAGLAELVEILLEDHKLIIGLIDRVKPLVAKAQSTALLTGQEWQTLRRQGDALVTELSAHAEKEEAALVPELEEVLEEKQAEEIYRRYRSLSV